MYIFADDLRKGVVIDIDGAPQLITDTKIVKPAKGASFVTARCRNLFTGETAEDVFFRLGERLKRAHIVTRRVEYLYNDGELCFVRDLEDDDQIVLTLREVEEAIPQLQEFDEFIIQMYEGKVFRIQALD